MDEKKIDAKLDMVQSGATPVDAIGGVSPRDIHGTVEIAKFLAESDIAVPQAFRKKAGACWRVVMQALDWGMPIYALMDGAYIVNDKVAYESKILHALIEKSGLLSKKLRPQYSGEGMDRKCTVIGFMKGETEPFEYETPCIKDISPRNSPLWKTDPDLQLWYFGVRRWKNKWLPQVALGFYSREDAEDHYGADNAKDVTPKPKLKDRLGGTEGRGFNADHVEKNTKKAAKAAEATQDPAEAELIPAATDAPQEAETPADEAPVETESASVGHSDAWAAGEKQFTARLPRRVPDEWKDFADAFLGGYDAEEERAKTAGK